MGRRISTSTVTKKSKMQRLKKSDSRPSTAPGPKSSNPYGSPPPPPSAFTGKAGWLKRVTKFGSSSSLLSNDKDGRASMANTFSSSHSVLSYDDDVDDFGSTAAADLDFVSAVTTTAPLHPPASRNASSILLGNNNGHGEGSNGRGEKLYDFLQALEIAPAKPIVPQRSRSRGSTVKQAPPLIDLTGGMYTRGNINRTSALPLYRSTPLPPPPVVHFALPSSSPGSSDNSPAGSTSTVARTLVDSRSRSSSGESSSNAKVRPSKSVTAATRATADDAKVQRPEASASPDVPVVLPITSKPKLTTRKRAPTPPEPTARVTSSTIPASRSTSSLPRSVSSPAVPDSSLRQQDEPKVEEGALAEILKEVTILLPAPPKAIHAPTSDPGLYLTWTSVRKVVLRAPPLTPEMQNDEGVAFPSSPSATVQGVTNKEDAQPSDNASPSETTDVTAVILPVPEPVLPRTPERAVVKSPRRQPQTPTTPTPSSPNLQVQAPIPSSIFFSPPPPAPSTPKAEESSSSDSPSHSPPPPQTPPKRPLSAASSSSGSDTSFHTATTKPTPISRPSSPRVPEPPATLCPTGAPPPPPEESSSTSRARQRTTDTTLASSSDSASVYEKTLAAISPEDIHISQRTLLEPVVRKASDVSLKQLFKELERTELSPSVATDIDGHSDGASGRPKKRSLNSLTGAVVGGVVGGVSGKKASRKRPATANAAVDLTKIKTPVSSPVLSVTNFHASGSLNPSSLNGAARSLGAAAAANTTATTNAGDVSPASSSRPPISTRRPRTATEPRQTRLEFALDSGRASPGKALNMNWDRDANPWDHPTFRSEGSVFKDPSSAPRTRAKSEASPQAASSASSTLTVKKESKRMSLSMRRPSTADSTTRKLLSKKSLQAIFTGSGSEQQQQQPTPSMPASPTSPTPTRRRSIASSSGPPTSFPASLKRSFTIRSNKSKHKGKEKELPPVPVPNLPVVLDNSEEASSAAAAASPDPSPSSFDSDRMLTMRDIYEASLIPIWDKDGHKVTFGKLFEDQVTIVVFIRHFWCPMCQDYMKSIAKDLEPGRLAQARVKLIVIGCGDPGMIRSYNDKIVKSPFEMYTDPKLLLFTALGMTLKTTDGGSEEHKGNYVKHGTLRGTLAVIGRALFSMSPGVMVKKGGDVKQLGGEFVLGPGLRCRFAHRMTTTRNHAPIRDVAITAGVQLARSPTLSKHLKTPSEEADWAARRKASTKKKAIWRSSVVDVLPPPPQAHLSSSICGDECPVQTNHLVGTI
ncbi:hypothetical protein FRC04_000353 [Tulasnella sp. 424]|nr:hypothetical protein FRC04_000353 [Tulasnella sp. 424]KAG8973311.1 hypothetical protein FRC05_008855 [Tulasnella sp. 425]